MKKCLLFLFLICCLNVSYAQRGYNKGGVFFCTKDLSPTAYGRLQQIYQYSSNAAIAGSVVSSSIGLSSLYKGYYKVGLGLLGLGGASYISYSYLSGLIEKVEQLIKVAQNPVSSSGSSWSNPNMNYIPIRKTSFDNRGNEIESYKHCSIMTANYKYADKKDDLSDDLIAIGHSMVKSLVQDIDRSKTYVEKAGYHSPALAIIEGLEPGTVCTLVKDFSVKDYRSMRDKMEDFFDDKEENTGYEIVSNNCCTVAYDYVVDVGGNTTVIDRSNFNHGIGIKKRSLKDFAGGAVEYVLSFFVGEKEHLEELEKKVADEPESDPEEMKQEDEL